VIRECFEERGVKSSWLSPSDAGIGARIFELLPGEQVGGMSELFVDNGKLTCWPYKMPRTYTWYSEWVARIAILHRTSLG
jgi:hypothetical protein